MSFMHEVKYRGSLQVTHWQPTHAQPRPGLIEANTCVKRLLAQEKQSSLCVLSISPDEGLKCVDTNFSPPKVIMTNSVYEIAHCGVDVSKPKLFTCIVGTKGNNALFFCHVFKCPNKETSSKITRAVANACTIAFQEHQKNKSARQARSAPPPSSGGGVVREARRASVNRARQSMRRGPGGPKLTDSWFRPSMTRGEVSTILRDGRVGDFLVRESQSQPGDYAISVQTGNDIWTGLIRNLGQGFQLGTRGGVLFDDLTDLIAFYTKNKFMNDSFGYPLTLRLPYDDAPPPGNDPFQPQPSPSTGGGMQRKPTFKNPPIFADISDQLENPDSRGQAPACGWPESSDEETDDQITFIPGSSNTDMSEKEAFEQILNNGGNENLPQFNVSELDAALDALNEIKDEIDGELGPDDDEFDPRGAGTGVQAPSSDVTASDEGAPPIQGLTDAVFQMCVRDNEGLIDGQEVRPILLRSGLDINTLGSIWMEVDQDRRGKIDFDQLGLILGLISMAQQGMEISLEELDPDTISPPTLQGVEVSEPEKAAPTVVPSSDPEPVVEGSEPRRGRATF
eukprot:m.24387 g.24387  ORF g.24387 m.24387 type:complete len:566 (+) comp13373_c0_seq1:251-1948(+)